jgi:hypothetical protein
MCPSELEEEDRRGARPLIHVLGAGGPRGCGFDGEELRRRCDSGVQRGRCAAIWTKH